MSFIRRMAWDKYFSNFRSNWRDTVRDVTFFFLLRRNNFARRKPSFIIVMVVDKFCQVNCEQIESLVKMSDATDGVNGDENGPILQHQLWIYHDCRISVCDEYSVCHLNGAKFEKWISSIVDILRWSKQNYRFFRVEMVDSMEKHFPPVRFTRLWWKIDIAHN